MQDRYTGDVGDYGKYGLLRQLCGLRDDDAEQPRLGVVWYRPEPETVKSDPANDGKHIAYLCPEQEARFRPCDSTLYEALREIVESGDRQVKRVEQSGVLGADALFYDTYIPGPAPGVWREARAVPRRGWTEGARRAVEGCDLVFLDPDNGLEPKSASIRSARATKYAYLEEVAPLVARGQSVVIYHHLSRNGMHANQIAHWLERLRSEFNPADIFALRYRRGTARAFFVLAQERHTPILRERTDALLTSPWREHFELHEPPT